MFRRNLIDLLLNRAMSVTQIARQVREAPRDVASDLEHFLRSLKHTNYQAIVTPAICRKCGFEFDADKLTKPSKCPKCHGTWLLEPTIEIREKPSDPGENESKN